MDKIVGTGEKVVGEVEGKPGKKVCFPSVCGLEVLETGLLN
jgi:hypothetical protein